MGLPVGEVQTAAIARLRGDTVLQGLLVGAVTPRWSIFDTGGVPTGQAFPYIVVSIITAKLGTALAMGTDATDIYLQTSTFDYNAGFARSRGIAKQVHADMEAQPLTLTGGFLNFFILLDNYQEIMQKDGLTSQVVQRWHLMTTG